MSQKEGDPKYSASVSANNFEQGKKEINNYFASQKPGFPDYNELNNEHKPLPLDGYIEHLKQYVGETDVNVGYFFKENIKALGENLNEMKLLGNGRTGVSPLILKKYTLKNHLIRQIANAKADGNLYAYLQLEEKDSVAGIPFQMYDAIMENDDTKKIILQIYRKLENDDVYNKTKWATKFVNEEMIRSVLNDSAILDTNFKQQLLLKISSNYSFSAIQNANEGNKVSEKEIIPEGKSSNDEEKKGPTTIEIVDDESEDNDSSKIIPKENSRNKAKNKTTQIEIEDSDSETDVLNQAELDKEEEEERIKKLHDERDKLRKEKEELQRSIKEAKKEEEENEKRKKKSEEKTNQKPNDNNLLRMTEEYKKEEKRKKEEEERKILEDQIEKEKNERFDNEKKEIQRNRDKAVSLRSNKVKEMLEKKNANDEKRLKEAMKKKSEKEIKLQKEEKDAVEIHENFIRSMADALRNNGIREDFKGADEIFNELVKYDNYITEQRIDIMKLKGKLQQYEDVGLDKYLKIPLGDDQFDQITDFTQNYIVMKKKEWDELMLMIALLSFIEVQKPGKPPIKLGRLTDDDNYDNIPISLYDLTPEEVAILKSPSTATNYKTTYLPSSSELIGKISLGSGLIHRLNYEEIVKGSDATGAEQFIVEFSDKTGVKHQTTISEIALFPGSCGDEIKSAYILDFRDSDAFNIQQSVRMNEGPRIIPSNGNLSLNMTSRNASPGFSIPYSIALMPDERITGLECVYEIANLGRLYTTIVDNDLQQLDMIILSSDIITSSFRTPPIATATTPTTTTTTIPVVTNTTSASTTTVTTGIQPKKEEETVTTGTVETEGSAQLDKEEDLSEEEELFTLISDPITDMRKTLMESLGGETASGGIIAASGDEEGDRWPNF